MIEVKFLHPFGYKRSRERSRNCGHLTALGGRIGHNSSRAALPAAWLGFWRCGAAQHNSSGGRSNPPDSPFNGLIRVKLLQGCDHVQAEEEQIMVLKDSCLESRYWFLPPLYSHRCWRSFEQPCPAVNTNAVFVYYRVTGFNSAFSSALQNPANRWFLYSSFTFKGPVFDLFSDLYSSFWTPAEQPCTIHLLKIQQLKMLGF